MNTLFAKAAREKWRFESSRGDLTTEQLWDLPLLAKNGDFDLNEIARKVHKKIKNHDDAESFVTATTADKLTAMLTDQLGLVKLIIAVKKAEQAAALETKQRADRRAKIRDILNDRSEEALRAKPTAELLAELENL